MSPRHDAAGQEHKYIPGSDIIKKHPAERKLSASKLSEMQSDNGNIHSKIPR